MNAPDLAEHEPSPASWRALAWLMGPPLAVLALRTLMPGEVDDGRLQLLEAATLVSTPGEALWMATRPMVYTVLGGGALLVALVLGLRRALRRHGWPRVRPWARGLWIVLWLALAVWLTASDLNRTARQPLPDQTVKVLLAGEVLPSKRGPGGAEVYFELSGVAGPMRLFAEGQSPKAFAVGSQPRLQVEAGRWWGRWGRLTSATPPAAAVPAPAASQPAAPASAARSSLP